LFILSTPFHLLFPLLSPISLFAVKHATLAAARIAGVFGVFTASRFVLETWVDIPSTASFWAGGAAVALPFAFNRSRTDFYESLVKEQLKVRVGRSFSVVAAFISGSIVLGTADTALKWVGVRW
jgi:hypothetical protein